MNSTDPELKKYLKAIARSNRPDQWILRGCIIGMFTALGTILGLAIIIFIGTQLMGGLKQIPLLDQILEQTKLDVLIERQVNQLTKDPDAEEPETETPETEPEPELLSYIDENAGIGFSYPATLSSIREINGSTDTQKVIQLNGDGALHNLDIYINETVTVDGDSSQRFVPRTDIERIVINLYEGGATVNGQHFSNAVFHSSIQYGGNTYNFIGLADTETPKLAREVFTKILESLSFSSPASDDQD